MIDVSNLDIEVDGDGKEICPYCKRSFASGLKSHLGRNTSCKQKHLEGDIDMENVETNADDELQEALKIAYNGEDGEDDDQNLIEGAIDEEAGKDDDQAVAELLNTHKRVKYVRDLPFESIPNFGKKKTEKVMKWLEDKGYVLTKQLAAEKMTVIAEIPGIKTEARQILSLAMQHCGKKLMTRAIDIFEDYEVVTTGVPALDEILGGGMRTDGSYVGFGPYNSGKTGLAQQMAANLQLDKEKGGLYNPDDPPICFWFDTEGTTDSIMKPQGKEEEGKTKTSRFRDIAYWTFKRHYDQGADESDDDYEARAIAFQRRVLVSTLVTDVSSSEDQIEQLKDIMETIDEYGNVKMIIVDSLINRFRSEFIGRENLAKRQQLLNDYIHKLHTLCGGDSILFVTNQVHDKPDSFGYGLPFKETGGNIVKHNIDVHLQMRRGQQKSIHIQIIDAAGLAPEDCNVRLTEKGIEPMD